MLRKVQSRASSASASAQTDLPADQAERDEGAAARADPGQQMQAGGRRQPRRANRKDPGWRRGSEMPFLDLRKKAGRDPLGEIGAFLLQEDQQRDARHRQQQGRQHRLGQRARRWQDRGNAPRPAQCRTPGTPPAPSLRWWRRRRRRRRHSRAFMPCRIISRAAATMPPTGEKGEISAMESRTSRAR